MVCAIIQASYVGGSIASAPFWVSAFKTGPSSSPVFIGFLTFWYFKIQLDYFAKIS
jgi:hypothetical protein